ncbi:MAG: hypothetical protein ABIF82_11380 [Planctomycetota bacterium]
MASAMSSCETQPAEIAGIPAGMPLPEALGRAAEACRQSLGARIRFVALSGPRWAYLAGERDASPAMRPFRRELLTPAVGLVADLRELIPNDQWHRILDALRDLIARST